MSSHFEQLCCTSTDEGPEHRRQPITSMQHSTRRFGSTTGRPPELKDDLQKALDERPTASIRELAQMIGRHHSTIVDRHYALGYRRVVARWISHELTDANRAARASIYQSLLLLPYRTDFLANVVTGDESWVG
ncbi:hypothetical protein ANCCEY_06915 [Ancylostoma ceylanicum]|uniref:Uncharacterized protein n=1 Tax=Ancylostoma ceylanicum TaxID=53326 RepID=A0A0D6LV86_9BILA|nr:hypothetical protein ANCCEY_06915 [Ancylostoma ceylanicum]